MYDNIHVGSEVDVSRSDGEILKGKVRWKGSIANRKGNWIGVELDTPGFTFICMPFIFFDFCDYRYHQKCKLEPSPFARFIMILMALTKALAKAYIKTVKFAVL